MDDKETNNNMSENTTVNNIENTIGSTNNTEQPEIVVKVKRKYTKKEGKSKKDPKCRKIRNFTNRDKIANDIYLQLLQGIPGDKMAKILNIPETYLYDLVKIYNLKEKMAYDCKSSKELNIEVPDLEQRKKILAMIINSQGTSEDTKVRAVSLLTDIAGDSADKQKEIQNTYLLKISLPD